MLKNLQELVLRISRTWWLYILVLLAFAGSLVALLRIGEQFPRHAGGVAPFDLQNGLKSGDVYPQIANYTEQARQLYYAFTAIDYLFPLFAGLFISATVAFALRNSLPAAYDALVERRLLLLLMVPTGFDWLENIAAISSIAAWPDGPAWLPVLLVTAKKLKLGCMLLGQAVMALSLLLAAVTWLGRRFRN